jgi:hypothetical protein
LALRAAPAGGEGIIGFGKTEGSQMAAKAVFNVIFFESPYLGLDWMGL